jgi:hypothetical protein
MNKAKCPKCGKEGTLEPSQAQEGRVILLCSCNPAGPVLETDAPPDNKKKEK